MCPPLLPRHAYRTPAEAQGCADSPAPIVAHVRRNEAANDAGSALRGSGIVQLWLQVALAQHAVAELRMVGTSQEHHRLVCSCVPAPRIQLHCSGASSLTVGRDDFCNMALLRVIINRLQHTLTIRLNTPDLSTMGRHVTRCYSVMVEGDRQLNTNRGNGAHRGPSLKAATAASSAGIASLEKRACPSRSPLTCSTGLHAPRECNCMQGWARALEHGLTWSMQHAIGGGIKCYLQVVRHACPQALREANRLYKQGLARGMG